MAKKMITNEQFISKLMQFSRHGVLMQAFIIEACEQYSDKVIAAHEAGKLDTGGFITPEAWVGCAKEYKEELLKKVANNTNL